MREQRTLMTAMRHRHQAVRFRPHGVVLDEARWVPDELGLLRYWLNDQASVYVSTAEDRQAVRVFGHPC